MPIEAVIFDCDGTLVDSERIGMEVMAEVAAEGGARFDVDRGLIEWRGLKMTECVALIEARCGVTLPPDFVPEFRRRSAEAFCARLRPIDGAQELIASLTVPYCVASSGPREKIELSLSITGLLPLFTGRIFSAYEVGHWKPHPGLFLHAAAAMDVDPASCAVIEDSEPGVEAGLAAGMHVFAFGELLDGTFRGRGVHHVRTLRELQAVLGPAVPAS